VNDFPTAVRIFEGTFAIPLAPSQTTKLTLPSGIKAKVENKGQYQQYLDELKPLREELGIPLKEDLYPEEQK
jgi:cytochrome c oxidase subunit 5a